ncbi:MAG: ABC transporter ATP-binding protein [archaeon]|nr:ABC transporter ATP-binding protein [archaeon]
MNALEVNKITKSYGKFKVLDGVSLKLPEGEIFGFLGPNGAGKSTLIRILLDFEKQDSGSFSFSLAGKKLLNKEVKKKVSIVPQDLCFYLDFSVEKNLEIMGALYGLGGIKLHERIERLLETWSLKRFRSRRAKNLSGGYKRLLNLACGLINDPAIIFLDEPTVGLDPKIRKTFWKKIVQLRTKGKTIIITTHYMDEAEVLCDRVALIVKGKIAEELSVSDLRKNRKKLEDLFIKIVEEQGIKREDI